MLKKNAHKVNYSNIIKSYCNYVGNISSHL